MSHEVTNRVMKECPMRGERRMLMLCLAHHADDEGHCWPSQKTLASESGCTERGVQKMIDALVKAGEIQIMKQGGGRGRSAEYRLTKYVEKGEPIVPPLPSQERANVETGKGERQNIKGEPDAIKGEPAVPPNTNRIPKESHLNTNVVPLPAALDCDEFRTAWSEWMEYRRTRKPKLSPYSEIGTKKQLKAMAEMGVARAIAAIDNSIAQNYQGIFEPKSHNGRAPTPPPKVDFSNGF